MRESSQGIYPLDARPLPILSRRVSDAMISRGTLEDSPRRTQIIANTYASLYCHIVSSTKNREAWISESTEERVWEYLGGIARHNGIVSVKIGGTEDHIHLVAAMPPTLSISRALQLLKGGASLWFHEKFRRSAFAWQDGYGAFTVGKSQLPDVLC